MNKKFIIAMLAAVLVLTSVVSVAVGVDVAKAADKAVLTVSEASGSIGEEVTVKVTIDSNPGIAGVDFKLNYDKSALEVVSATEGSVLTGPVINTGDAGIIGYSAALSKNTTATGELLIVKFKVLDAAKPGSTIAFTVSDEVVCDEETKDVAFEFKANGVKVVCKHPNTTEKVTNAATCEEKGTKSNVCSVCGETVSTVDIPALGHSYDAGVVTKTSTCEEKGVKTYTCAICAKTKVEDVEALGHSYDAGVVTKAPTCEEKGVKTLTCATCAKTKVEDIDALGHKASEAVVTKPATCTTEGEKTSACTVCNKTFVETIPMIEHSYGEFKVVKEATTSAEGLKQAKCIVCGATIDEVIPVKAEAATSQNTSVPNTGDATSIMLYVIIGLLAMGVFTYGYVTSKN